VNDSGGMLDLALSLAIADAAACVATPAVATLVPSVWAEIVKLRPLLAPRGAAAVLWEAPNGGEIADMGACGCALSTEKYRFNEKA
jgi:hypothetical protein